MTLPVLFQYFQSSSTLATCWEEQTHWKRPWCWERLRAGEEVGDRGWDGLMASPTRWTWVWINSRSWWWTGRPGMLWFMGSQRIRHDWATELNWLFPKLDPTNQSMTVSWFESKSSCVRCFHENDKSQHIWSIQHVSGTVLNALDQCFWIWWHLKVSGDMAGCHSVGKRCFLACNR